MVKNDFAAKWQIEKHFQDKQEYKLEQAKIVFMQTH